MSIQARLDNVNEPLVLSDDAEFIDGITIEAAQGDLLAGAVLGEVTADPGVYALVDATAVDGTDLPKLILAEDVANDAGQQAGKAGYTTGLFAAEKLTFGGVTTLDSRVIISAVDAVNVSMRDALRMFGLRTANTVSLTGFENA